MQRNKAKPRREHSGEPGAWERGPCLQAASTSARFIKLCVIVWQAQKPRERFRTRLIFMQFAKGALPSIPKQEREQFVLTLYAMKNIRPFDDTVLASSAGWRTRKNL